MAESIGHFQSILRGGIGTGGIDVYFYLNLKGLAESMEPPFQTNPARTDTLKSLGDVFRIESSKIVSAVELRDSVASIDRDRKTENVFHHFQAFSLDSFTGIPSITQGWRVNRNNKFIFHRRRTNASIIALKINYRQISKKLNCFVIRFETLIRS